MHSPERGLVFVSISVCRKPLLFHGTWMRHQLVAGPDPNDSKLSRLLLRSDTISNFSTQGKQFPSIEAGSGLVFDRQLGVSPSHRTSDANSLFSRDATSASCGTRSKRFKALQTAFAFRYNQQLFH